MDNSGLIPSPYFLLELVPTNNVEESSPLPVNCIFLKIILLIFSSDFTL